MSEYSVRDRQNGSTCGTIDAENGVNSYWRYTLLRGDEVIALFRRESEAQDVADALNGGQK